MARGDLDAHRSGHVRWTERGARPADEDLLSYSDPAGTWDGFDRQGGTQDLLLFDARTGNGAFYRAGMTHAYGDWEFKVARMRPHVGWRSWTQIVPGMFGGYGLTDLLLFEASTGTAEFYAVRSDAALQPAELTMQPLSPGSVSRLDHVATIR